MQLRVIGRAGAAAVAVMLLTAAVAFADTVPATGTCQTAVLPNTPPTLPLPDDLTVEATSPAGAAATYSVTATDAEDAVAPTPSCSPASGSTFAFGTTKVACTVTDSGGLTTNGSFHVMVQDTTAPSLV